MARLFDKNEMRYLNPPTEEQWRAIWKQMSDKKWLVPISWKSFEIMNKLPYAKAVVSTDDSGKKLL